MHVLSVLLSTLALISIMGIVIAFSPTLVVTELTILTRSKKPVLQSIAFIMGIALAVTLFCLVALVLIDPNKDINVPSTREIIRGIPLTDIVVGIILIVVSRRIARPNSKPKVKEHRFKPEKLLSTRTLFWFGFIKMATSLSSIAAIILAAQFINTSVNGGTLRLASVLWLIAVALFPFVLILLLKQYRPLTFGKIQSASDWAINLNWRRVIAIALLASGGYFIIIGALNLGLAR